MILRQSLYFLVWQDSTWEGRRQGQDRRNGQQEEKERGKEEGSKATALILGAPLLPLALTEDTTKKRKIVKEKIETFFVTQSGFIPDPRINIGRLLRNHISDQDFTILLQNCKVLPTSCLCPQCGQVLSYTSTHASDGFKYARCKKMACSRTKIGMNNNTLLSKSNISKETFFILVYGFIKGWKYDASKTLIIMIICCSSQGGSWPG